MRRQIGAAKTGGLSGDVIAAVATSGIAFNVSSRSGDFDTVNLTFSHCEPRFQPDDFMHLRLLIFIPKKETVEDIFNIVKHHIGGDWKRENLKGCFAGDNDDMPAAFGQSQILDDFVSEGNAGQYMRRIAYALPQFDHVVCSNQFGLRRALAATCFDRIKHKRFHSKSMAKKWVSCLRDAGLSEYQIGQWGTLFCEASKRFDPTDRNPSLSRSIQDAAAFLMSNNGQKKSKLAWSLKPWDHSGVHGIRKYRKVETENPPYEGSFFDVTKVDSRSMRNSAALMTATDVSLCYAIAD